VNTLVLYRSVRLRVSFFAPTLFLVRLGRWTNRTEQGDADAQKELGDMYRSGEGVTKDINEAAKWYHKSAEQGNGDAQYILGSLYSKGDGVLKDSTEALK
jgi:TPR repeat protein